VRRSSATPSVLDTPERVEDIDVPDLPRAHPGFWRTLAQSLVRPHAQRSSQTPRSCAITRPQKMETLAERFARQYPFLYIQAGSDL
jgi:hypothetical protein